MCIVGSCNGLLLCGVCRNWRDYYYYVYNPTTGCFKTLPAHSKEEQTWESEMVLAFEPRESPHYKVVCVRGLYVLGQGKCRYQLEVYESETGAWTKRGAPFTAHLHIFKWTYWNGAIHGISMSTTSRECLSVSLDDGMHKTMPLPSCPDGFDPRSQNSDFYFGECCDHLHLIQLFESLPQLQFDVYEMKRDYSEWFVKYKVDLSPLVDVYPEMMCPDRDGWDRYAFWILAVVRGVKEEDTFLVLRVPGKAVRYNLVDKTFETLLSEFADKPTLHSLDSRTFLKSSRFAYIESLCCV